MSIETTYREIIINDYIKDQLSHGVAVSSSDVEDQLEELIAASDLTVPQFNSESYHVIRKGESSASKFRNTFLAMRQDIRVLYKEMIRLSQISGEAFERWRLEAESLERRLIDLEGRIENLLLLTQDTEGYHNIIVDNFTDLSQVDIDLSTIEPDVAAGTIEMGASSVETTRIFLNNLNLIDDLIFKVRTTIDFLSRTDAVGTTLVNPFRQTSASWWTNIQMRSQKAVTCELTVRLTNGEPIDISRITLSLHHAAESSPMNITPLYSTDNQTFNQLPSTTFTQEVKTSASFAFPSVKAKWVKFLLTKQGPDPSSSGGTFFSYQFGFKEIAFFAAGFSVDTTQQLISKPLWVIGLDGNPVEFERLTLEACERVEEGTAIDYFFTTSNDAEIPADENTIWTQISPINRIDQPFPTILEVGDTLESTIGDTQSASVDDEVVIISYDGRANPPAPGDTDFRNPGRNFYLLSRDPSLGTVLTTQIDSSKASTLSRYSFVNTNDRILNYQIQDASLIESQNVKLDETSLLLFRNVGKQGLVNTDITATVRGISRGWKFEDPYYSCVIQILNPEGISIDFGDQTIFINEIANTNKVNETVLTGKSGINTGIHTVKVHKNNWLEVTPSLNTLAALQEADTLYPYNHKLLIEGYLYGSSYSSLEEKVYAGVDLFAETVMDRISPFDMIANIAEDRYDVYALDRDVPNGHYPSFNNEPSLVFLLKVDDSNPDFQNERFVLRFKQVNELRKYLRLRADFSTEDEGVSATLHSYKIKLG
jgi:hypothetical protein